MKRIRALINKETLLYIVQGKKVSNDYIIKKCKCQLEQLESWLDSSIDIFPTITQAKKLSSCLHIPFAALYMDKKDIKLKEIPRISNKRTIPDSKEFDDSLINITLVDIINERDFLIEARKELGINSEVFDANVPVSDDPKVWANEIRKHFGLDIKMQFSCNNTREFFLYLRSQIEKKGIFIYCFKGIDIETIRGIAIFDQIMPMIGINIKDRHPAKSFSIIHEIVHLYKRQSSLCNEMYNSFSSQQEEIFCNAVAGELLVPTENLQNALKKEKCELGNEIKLISILAKKFSVSKEVIVRRLYDTHQINNEQFLEYSNILKAEFDENKNRSESINTHRKARKIERNMSKAIIDCTSSEICRVLYEGYCEQIYDEIYISEYLKLNIDYVDSFINEVAEWGS